MENGKKYTSIGISVEVKDRLDNAMPKAYTYDDCILALVEIWENKKKSGTTSGKSAQNNQTS
jgi:hypothetical protein